MFRIHRSTLPRTAAKFLHSSPPPKDEKGFLSRALEPIFRQTDRLADRKFDGLIIGCGIVTCLANAFRKDDRRLEMEINEKLLREMEETNKNLKELKREVAEVEKLMLEEMDSKEL